MLEVRTNDEFGKHIVATQDIEIGQIILLEELYIFDISSTEKTHCKTCLHIIVFTSVTE